MKTTPYKIPRSLLPYKEQYENDPEKAVRRLERHVKKRGADAVGYYLLSTFYYQMDRRDKAVQAAWKAKIFAAGSPSMKQLHYFMLHPEKFKAWDPSGMKNSFTRRIDRDGNNAPIRDLDSLISKLSSIEPKKLTVGDDQSNIDLGEESTRVDDIATETLAEIHIKQGNISSALLTYERLIKRYPKKADIYSDKIAKLKNSLG